MNFLIYHSGDGGVSSHFYFSLFVKNCVQVRTVEMVVEKPRICNASSQTIVVTCVLVNNDAPKNKTKETTNTMIIQLIT